MAVHAISQQDLKFSFLHNVYTHTLFAVFCMHMHVRITVVPRGVPYKSYLHSTAKYLSIPPVVVSYSYRNRSRGSQYSVC